MEPHDRGRMDRWIPAAGVDAALPFISLVLLCSPLPMTITQDLTTSQFDCFQAISFPALTSPAAQL